MSTNQSQQPSTQVNQELNQLINWTTQPHESKHSNPLLKIKEISSAKFYSIIQFTDVNKLNGSIDELNKKVCQLFDLDVATSTAASTSTQQAYINKLFEEFKIIPNDGVSSYKENLISLISVLHYVTHTKIIPELH